MGLAGEAKEEGVKVEVLGAGEGEDWEGGEAVGMAEAQGAAQGAARAEAREGARAVVEREVAVMVEEAKAGAKVGT